MKRYYIILTAFLNVFNFGFTQIEDKRPNILFLILDDAGLDMSAYGSSYVNTPAFDAIAKEGVLFNNAYTPNAKCSPSRASLITGRNSWQLDAAANHYIYFPPQFKTYQEVLLENGYFTGFTGKGYVPGKTLTESGEERLVMGEPFNIHKLEAPTTAISPKDYAKNFETFLSEVPKNKPWSFWVGFHEPHRKYEFGSGEKLGGKIPEMINEVPKYWPDSLVVRQDLLDYAYEIEYADNHIARIMKCLEYSGQLENTFVIVTSDQGMPFPRVKGQQYETANHVPLAILWKKKMTVPNRTVDDYVSFIDMAPTLLEVAGIDWKASGMYPSPGKSILNLIASEKSGSIDVDRNFVLVGKERHDTGRPQDQGYPIRGMFRNNMLFLKNYETSRWPSGNPELGYLNVDSSPVKTLLLNLRRENIDKHFWQLNFGKRPIYELYDLKTDPYCLTNLASNPLYSKIKNEFEKDMEAKLLEQNDLRMMGYGHIYEQKYHLTKNSFLYDRYMAGEPFPEGWMLPTDREEYYIDDDGKNLEKVKRTKNIRAINTN